MTGAAYLAGTSRSVGRGWPYGHLLPDCVAMILMFTVVPWKFDYSIGSFPMKVNKGYSFIWSPPIAIASIDYQQILI
jgi:hypothetical protein